LYIFSFHDELYVPGSTDRYRNDRLGNKKNELKKIFRTKILLNARENLLLLYLFFFRFPKHKLIFHCPSVDYTVPADIVQRAGQSYITATL